MINLIISRAAMYGQEEGNREGEQRNYGQQQLAAYQGQEPEQQGQQQEEQGAQQPEGPQQDEQQGRNNFL